jgi:PilZ domain-containing protein
VSEPCVVLIGSPDLLPSLRTRAGAVNGELIEFSHLDAVPALEAITQRRPQMVALERLFAMTARGAALINRVKADPSLQAVEIRVLAHDSDYTRVVPRAKAPAVAAPALDQTGTRRAPRLKIAGRVEVVIDGKTAVLVDLSTVGAQVVTQLAIKVDQELAMALPDTEGVVRFKAKVAWTAFAQTADGAPRYRAGIDFVEADAEAVGAFIDRHKG